MLGCEFNRRMVLERYFCCQLVKRGVGNGEGGHRVLWGWKGLGWKGGRLTPPRLSFLKARSPPPAPAIPCYPLLPLPPTPNPQPPPLLSPSLLPAPAPPKKTASIKIFAACLVFPRVFCTFNTRTVGAGIGLCTATGLADGRLARGRPARPRGRTGGTGRALEAGFVVKKQQIGESGRVWWEGCAQLSPQPPSWQMRWFVCARGPLHARHAVVVAWYGGVCSRGVYGGVGV